MSKLHPELAAFIEQHRTGVAAHRSAMQSQLVPVADVATQVRQFMIDLQGRLHVAELTATNGALSSKLGFIHTRIASTEQAANAWFAAGRALALRLSELERGFPTDVADLERLIELHGGSEGETPGAQTPGAATASASASESVS